MRGYKSIIQDDQDNYSTEGSSLDISDVVNQCNTTTVVAADDLNSESKSFTPDLLLTEYGFDRHLLKLHTNMDSRFSIPNTLSNEMRRSQIAGLAKTNVHPMKRYTFNANPSALMRSSDSEKPAEETLSISLKNERKVSRNAKEWPNPLTSKDQAQLIQQFCAYFYQRYCTLLGELQLPEVCTEPAVRNDTVVETSWHGDPQGPMKHKAPERRHALCPYFFTSSLADAVKIAERPAGRPWPVILLYLHHDESIHTQTFVTNILCSLREDYKSQEPNILNARTKEAFESSRNRLTSSETEEKGPLERKSYAKQNKSTTIGSQIPSILSNKPRRLSVILTKSESHQTSIVQSSEKCPTTFKNGVRCCRKSASRTAPGTTPRRSTLERDNLDPRPPELLKKVLHQRSSSGSTRLIIPTKQTNINSGCDNRHDTVTSPVPSENYALDSDKQSTIRAIPRLLIAPGDGEHLEVKDDNEYKHVYTTSYKTKSFRGLLLERSAGLIPWDCTGKRARSYLAAAFPGTRLAQWLEEWQKPDFYPALVAVGRTAEREVVCSYLSGATATAVSALRWLNDVTVAHLNNYRQPVIPTCPERSEKLFLSPSLSNTSTTEKPLVQTKTVSPVDSTHLIPPAIMNTSTQPITDLHTTNSKKSGSDEMTEHTFISMLNVRPNPRQALSPGTTDDMAYRVTKTPQIVDGPLSSLFELPVEIPSGKLLEQLKRIQSSFKAAASTLAKSITAESLVNRGIHVHRNKRSKSGESSKSISSQILVDAPSVQSDTQRESPHGRSSPKRPVILNDLNQYTSESSSRPKQSSLTAPQAFGQKDSRNHKHREPKNENVDQIQSQMGSADQPSSSSNPITPPRIVHRWWSMLSMESTNQGIQNGTEFYEQFTEQFTKEFPLTPAFLIGRFQTAVLRSMDVMNHEQIAPILIYLHDKQAPGVDHFVANILCSRRFTSKLFDHGLHIWPLDVTSIEQKPVRTHGLLSLRSFDRLATSHKKFRQTDGTTHSLTESRNQTRKSHTARRTKSSFDRVQLGAASELSKHSLRHRTGTDVDRIGSGHGFDLSNGPSLRANYASTSRMKANRWSVAAQQLLDYFTGHPAQESIKRILSIPVLPVVINVSYHKDNFYVTHVLIPSSTTKEAIAWLSNVIKMYSKSRVY